MQETFIGIDVSKEKIDIAFRSDGKSTSKIFANSQAGYEAVLTYIRKSNLTIKSLCMEATGRYSESVAEFFFEHGFSVVVANPLQIKRFGQSTLVRNKTDKVDACVIAQFAEAMRPQLWQPQSPQRKSLKHMFRQLQHVKTQLMREQNRFNEERDPFIRSSIERVIQCLRKEVNDLQKSIEKLSNDDHEISKQKELLISIPGIGQETACCLIAHLEMDRFEKAKQVSAFAGLNPQQHQSGSSVRGKTRISKMGDRHMRKALYMPAIVAKRYNPIISSFYERLLHRGMAKRAAICACMRKLLHIAYGVLKTKVPFSSNHSNMMKAAI